MKRFSSVFVIALLLIAKAPEDSLAQKLEVSAPVPQVTVEVRGSEILEPQATKSPQNYVDVTYYQALPSQTDSDPSIAACGPNLAPWIQVAVSRDLFFDANGKRRCGHRVRLRFSDGREMVGVINDTMNRRFRDRIDVLVANHENARSYGREKATLEWIEL